MKIPFILFNLLTAACLISTAGSGQTTHVWGKVVDKKTEKPLYGVNISLQDNPLSIGTITNKNGEFRLWNLPGDTAHILISFDGYQDYVLDITSKESSANDLNIVYLKEGNDGEEKQANSKLQLSKRAIKSASGIGF